MMISRAEDSSAPSTTRMFSSEAHEHDIAQTAFLAAGALMNAEGFASHSDEFKRIVEGLEEEPKGRLGRLLKVGMARRGTTVREAEELMKRLSAK